MPPLSIVDVVMLALAPALMVVVSLFERRWGPVIGGMVAAAPITALIGLLLVSSNLGRDVGADMAITMAGYAPAQIGIAIVIASVVGRVGFVPGLVLGTSCYGVLAWVSQLLPAPVAVAVSCLSLGIALRLLRIPRPAPDSGPSTKTSGWLMIGLRAAVSLATAVGLLLIADQFGAAAGGAFGGYPIFTVTLCGFVFAQAGAVAVQRVLIGMISGLPAYLVFVLVYGLTADSLGPAAGSAAAAILCSMCYLLPGLRVRPAVPAEDAKPDCRLDAPLPSPGR